MEHDRLRSPMVLTVCLAIVALLPWAAPAQEAPLTREEMAAFLQTAKIVRSSTTKKGVTRPSRVTLSDGRLTQDALFQSVDEAKPVQSFQGGRVEIDWRDSWVYNVAAYRLAELIGLGGMVPVTVERTHDRRRGSLAWWITAKWDEQERRKAGAEPPDRLAWTRQIQDMHLFTELVYDTDRNLGNLLITEEWKLWMVDFTRAFRRHTFLRQPQRVQQCSRTLRNRLQALTRDDVVAAVGKYLGPVEVKALLHRRNLLVERLDGLAAERGEATVYY